MIEELIKIKLEEYPDLNIGAQKLERVCEFYTLMKTENEIQNLTRLIEPQDWIDGHLVDCLEFVRLLKKETKVKRILDIGSGCGVPGILTAILARGDLNIRWGLSESERSKSDFLLRSVGVLEMETLVSVYSDRAEKVLSREKFDAFCVRAVGSVSKIYTLISKCSTWNIGYLFKGPKFLAEWDEYLSTHPRSSIKIQNIYEYSVGELSKQRKIVSVVRE